MKIKSEFKPFQSKATYFSPLALITLAACGGGGGGVAVSGGAAAGAGGAVIKGPLENALVFIDYDQDGTQDAGEPSVRTNADGSYFIEHAAGKDDTDPYDVVAVADAGTVDASTGASASGFTLSAPKDATVVTPTTTMVTKSGGALTAADVATALGLPAGVDPLTFNPYASGVNAADALAVEKVAQQVMGAVTAFGASLEGAGASADDAFSLALDSIVAVVADNKAASTTLDLTDAADIASIATKADTLIGTADYASTSGGGWGGAAWTALKSNTTDAIKAVADNIAAVDSLTSDAAKGSFGNVEVLKAQVKSAAVAEKAQAGDGVGVIEFMNAANVASSASNLAPTAIALGTTSISEAADSLVVGTVTTTDPDQPDDTPFKYSLAQVAGEDFAKFSINESTGVLTLLEQPDFETKASYKVSVKSEDSGGKTLVEAITVSVVDANDPPTLDGVTGLASVENAADATGTFTAVDSNGDTLTYLIPGVSATNGVYTVDGTYGTLTLTEATGAYTYALNNNNSTVNDLLEYAETNQVEKITSPTAPTIAVGDKFKVSINSIDIETAAAAGTESGLAGIVDLLNTANAAPLVAGTFAVDGSDITFTYTATGKQAGTISKLFFMDSSAGTAYDSGTGTGAELTAGASNFLTETFNIQVHDTNYYVTKAVSFNIQGKNDIATLNIPTDGLVTEVTNDSVVTATGVITAADLDSDTPTVTLTGVSTVTDVSGTDTYQKVGTYGTLVMNKDPNDGTFTHQYTYTLNNADADTLALSGADLMTESFGITVTDEDGGVGTSTLDIKVQGYGVTMNSVSGDEKINLAEATEGFAISGRGNVGKVVTLSFSDSSVTLAGGNTATVDANGDWTVAVTAADVTAMGQGSESVTATLALDDSTNVATDPKALTIDTVAPTVAITGFAFDVSAKTITASGSGFLTVGAADATVTDRIDLSKIAWDIDGTGTNLEYLAAGDATAVVTSDSALVLTLSDAKYAALVAKAGFAADGIGATNTPDKIVVLDGAFSDASGNTQTTGAANLAPTYSDTTKALLAEFTSTSVEAAATGSFALGAEINITATMNEAVLGGSTITATLSTANDVVLTAASNGTTLTGTYAVPTGKSSSGLSVQSFTYTSVTDVYGNTHTADAAGSIPSNKNLNDHGTIVIDTAGPTSTITAMKYTDSISNQIDDPDDDGSLTIAGPGIIEITGTAFNEIAANATDVKSYLDWTKFVWDLDADDTNAGVTFAVGDITSAVVTSNTKITVTLTTAKTTSLEATAGFAADGIGDTNTADQIVVSAGFAKDEAGNPSTTDAATVAPTYQNTGNPTIASVTSSSADGPYGLGDDINVTVNTSEIVLGGSALTVTLGTGDAVVVTAAANGTTLVGTYTVPVGKSSADLSVTSVAAASGQSVTDLYGKNMTSFTIPSNKSLADLKAITIDTAGPSSTITAVKYTDSVSNQIDDPDDDGSLTIAGPGIIEITGTAFNEIAANATDVKSYLDWTKFVWDLDADDTNAGVTFAVGDITSAVVTSNTKITVTLTTAKTTSLEATAGFAADGIGDTNTADQIVVSAGFTKDPAGNASTTDAATVAPTYQNTGNPTIASVTSSSADGPYGLGDDINVTVNTSEIVLGGSALTVTLGTGDAVVVTAAANGTTLVGTYTVPVGKSSADLSVTSVAAASGQSVTDLYGKNMTSFTIPSNKSLADLKAITIDTAGPSSTITAVKYTDSVSNQIDDPDDDGSLTIAGPGIIEITGTAFNEIAANATDVKSYLDWTKFVWDLDADDTNAGVTFAVGDITSAVVTSNTKITVTLTTAKTTSLEATAGFAADGIGDTNTADQIVVSAGFTKDPAGNASTTDAATVAPTYQNTGNPTIASVTSSSADGPYGLGDDINVTVNTSEIVLGGSALTVTLGTGDAVVVTAAANGTTLVGTYTVPVGKSSADLSVTSVAAASGQSVTDLYGKNMTSFTIPSNKSLADLKAITIDTAGPSSTITAVKYTDSVSNQIDDPDDDGSLTIAGPGIIEITGTAFNEIAANATDVKSYLDWTKFVWDLDADDTNAGVTFAVGDITSAVVTSNTKITVTLTTAKTTSLEATAGFAGDGLTGITAADEVVISAGFTRDPAGNASTTDAVTATPSYQNTDIPALVSFTSTTDDGNYTIGDRINITANVDEAVLQGSSITVTLDTGDTVVMTANTNGTKMVGTYQVPSGKTSTDLSITGVAVTATKTVTDLYGKNMSTFAVPANQNISDNKAIVIDTTSPTSTITDIEYDAANNTIAFNGDNFTSAGSQGVDIKAQLDWSMLVWDIDGSPSDPGVSFVAGDITSATVTSNTKLSVVLGSAKANELEGTLGFAADGLGSVNTADQVDVSAGFIKDATGNAATTDAALNTVVTFADTVRPAVQAFTSSTADGAYKNGESINITATMTETVLAGSKITVILGTTDKVELTTSTNSTSLTGTYTVSALDNSADLAVSSFSLTDISGAATTVTDVYGNFMQSTSMPGSQNLSDNKAIVVDNIPIAGGAVVATSLDPDDTIVLNFSEAVTNHAALATTITSNEAVYGSSNTAVWNDGKTALTVTLKTGESVVDDQVISFTNVEDAAGNVTDTINFTVDIS